jgi:hypothetical protein
MVEEMLKFTKLTFIIHFVIGLIFTILFWIPDITIPLYTGISGLTLETHAMSLTIGSLFAGFTVSSLFGFLVKEWKQVKIIVISEIIWLLGNLVASIISFNVFTLSMAILTIIITVIMLLLFILSFLQQEDMMNPFF